MSEFKWRKTARQPKRAAWLYVLAGTAWIVGTDLLYDLWKHEFTISTYLFTAIRSVVFFLITAPILYRLLQRMLVLESNYRNLVEFSPQPILVHANEKWVFVNPAGLDLLGAKSEEELVGQSIWDRIHPAYMEVGRKEITKLYASNRPTQIYLDRRLIRMDGSVIDVELRAVPMEFQGLPAIQLLYTDVTERKKKERELRAVQSELESFIEHNVNGIILFDTYGRVRRVNQALENMFLRSREDMLGQPLLELRQVPDEYKDEARELMKAVLSGGSIVGHQTVRMNSKGEQVHVLLSMFPTFHDGQITGWAAVLNDISERKQAEQRLLQSEKLAAIGQMAASIAHEIKNPLTTLSGFLDLLLLSPPNKQETYIHIMTTEMQRITEIVNEMLALAKPQRTDYQLINLTEVLSGVCTLLQPEATMKSANFDLNLSEHVQNIMVFGHENRLKQLFINVIQNSLEALDDKTGKVSVSLSKQADSCLIEVTDTGGGMTPEQIAQLGEPFKTTKTNGTGLGLLVSKQIVEQHHGDIEFISELGRGTTVRISLPLGHVDATTQI